MLLLQLFIFWTNWTWKSAPKMRMNCLHLTQSLCPLKIWLTCMKQIRCHLKPIIAVKVLPLDFWQLRQWIMLLPTLNHYQTSWKNTIQMVTKVHNSWNCWHKTLLAIGCFIKSRSVSQHSLDKYFKKVNRTPSKSVRQSPAQSFENHHQPVLLSNMKISFFRTWNNTSSILKELQLEVKNHIRKLTFSVYI